MNPRPAAPDRVAATLRRELVGRSRAVREIRKRLRRVAHRRVSPVLIQGATGAGKECVARAYHAALQCGGPLVAVNTAGLPETLLDAALFGHEKGSFTGAEAEKAGFVECAQGGVLFLDEIGVAPMAVQTKLLRLVENAEFYPVGSTRLRSFRGVLVFATSRDLAADANETRFLPDLYHRLQREIITMPPLRDRPDDIPVLVEHFLNGISTTAARRLGLEPAADRPWRITPRAMALLQQHAWPGNVRELIHVLGRATRRVALAERYLGLDTIRAELAPVLDDFDCGTPIVRLDDYIAAYVRTALQVAGGNLSAAAEQLGISRGRLRRILGRTR